MSNLERNLSVVIDGNAVKSFSRAYLFGTDAIGLDPLPFTLRLWNLSDSDYNAFLAASNIVISCEDTILASGKITDVCRGTVPEGTVSEITFSPSIELWEAPVSLSVAAGKKVSETIEAILEASETGITLLAYSGSDPSFARGQAFFGRAAECVLAALSAASARICMVGSGVYVIPQEGLPVSMKISEKDLIDAPQQTGSNMLLLKTRAIGWPLGKEVEVSWGAMKKEGLVVMRSVNADNQDGDWESELLLEVKA